MKTGLLVPAIVMLAACQQPAALSVDKAWVRLTPVDGAPSGAYFTLKGGARDETLTAISVPDAARAEMHESTDRGGITGMRELKLVAVRAGGSVTFAPGDKHVMLFGLKPTVRAGTTTPITFTFASGQKITVNAKVMPPGGSAPAD
jgi:copper(I)-binding protein